MPRLTPSVEVRPLAGLLWYGLVIVIVIGLVGATTGGGFLVWLAFWLLVAAVVYAVIGRSWRRFGGT